MSYKESAELIQSFLGGSSIIKHDSDDGVSYASKSTRSILLNKKGLVTYTAGGTLDPYCEIPLKEFLEYLEGEADGIVDPKIEFSIESEWDTSYMSYTISGFTLPNQFELEEFQAMEAAYNQQQKEGKKLQRQKNKETKELAAKEEYETYLKLKDKYESGYEEVSIQGNKDIELFND